jgi:hypothetical protein
VGLSARVFWFVGVVRASCPALLVLLCYFAGFGVVPVVVLRVGGIASELFGCCVFLMCLCCIFLLVSVLFWGRYWGFSPRYLLPALLYIP